MKKKKRKRKKRKADEAGVQGEVKRAESPEAGSDDTGGCRQY